MIAYEDLCAALDRYVARKGGASLPASSYGSSAMAPHGMHVQEPYRGDSDGGYARVGTASSDAAPPQVHDDRSNEIDLGDVLSEDAEM